MTSGPKNVVYEKGNCHLNDYCKAIILSRRIYNDFLKFTGLREQKVTILTHSQRSIGQYMDRFLHNDF